MYLHLGQDVVVRFKDIIGIFDIENTTISGNSRKFLSDAEKKRQVITVSYEMPKSFIVCSKNNKGKETTVYISQISSSTLKKRAGFLDNNLKDMN